jgi:hypothetical protein
MVRLGAPPALIREGAGQRAVLQQLALAGLGELRTP